ncbi:MAG TPA: hypothetical protein ENK82_03235 [Campylobacterales bacterium]|nr:hypothetical protein [Campylobacterales bacterium]
MSERYLVKVKPLEPFFFGGELTFGADETRKGKEQSSRYSATSTQFPQQTALLGMLRKTMLIQNGNLTMHKKGEWVDSFGKNSVSPNYDEAKELVGTEAFSYTKEIEIGKIESISPLLICHEDKYYIANAKDDEYELKERVGMVSFGQGQKKAFVLEGYDAKKSKPFEFISNTQEKKNYLDFFKELQSVGIKKSLTGQTEEDAFFRRKSYYPKDKAYFSFVVTFKEKMDWLEESVVSLGADQSSFKFEIEEIDNDFDDLFSENHQTKALSRIVLASSTLVSQEAYELCSFVLGERKTYRQLTDTRKGKKSQRYYLLEKGSVLYSEEIENLEKLLDQKHLQNIGLNHYFSIKGNSDV